LLALLQTYLTGNFVAVSTRVAPGGVQSALLYDAMQTINLVAAVPGLTEPLIQDVSFVALTINSQDNQTVSLSGTVAMTVWSPLGPNTTITLEAVSVNCDMIDPVTQNMILIVDVPTSQEVSQVSQGDLIIATIDVSIVIAAADIDLWIGLPAFLHSFITEAVVNATLSGTGNAQLFVGPLGNVPLVDLPVTVPTSLRGMDNLNNKQVTSVSMNSSTADQVVVEVLIDIFNPSVAVISVGDLTMDLLYNGSHIGQLSSLNVAFAQTWNTISFTGLLDSISPDNVVALEGLFNNYLGSSSSIVTASAGAAAVQNMVLALGFVGFEMDVVLPPMTASLVKGISFQSVSLDPTTAPDMGMTATATVSINSPLGNAPLVIQAMGITGAALTDSSGLAIGGFSAPSANVSSLGDETYQTYLMGSIVATSSKLII